MADLDLQCNEEKIQTQHESSKQSLIVMYYRLIKYTKMVINKKYCCIIYTIIYLFLCVIA